MVANRVRRSAEVAGAALLLVAGIGIGQHLTVASRDLTVEPSVSSGVDSAGEAPWAVRVVPLPSKSLCTGSVIAARWVLTAGHCFLTYHDGSARVAIGGRTVSVVGSSVVVAPAAVGDVALLKLDADAGVAPVRLAESEAFVDSFDNKGVTFFGWGMTRMPVDRHGNPAGYEKATDPAVSLRKTPDGAFVKAPYCSGVRNMLDNEGPALCFLKTRTFGEDGVATLPGDSGGPWVAWSSGWVQIATAAGGLSGETRGSIGPDVGVDLSAPSVRGWINSVMFPTPTLQIASPPIAGPVGPPATPELQAPQPPTPPPGPASQANLAAPAPAPAPAPTTPRPTPPPATSPAPNSPPENASPPTTSPPQTSPPPTSPPPTSPPPHVVHHTIESDVPVQSCAGPRPKCETLRWLGRGAEVDIVCQHDGRSDGGRYYYGNSGTTTPYAYVWDKQTDGTWVPDAWVDTNGDATVPTFDPAIPRC